MHLIEESHGGMYGNRLLRMYGRCGCMRDAWSLFSRMHRRDSHSWRFMIAAFSASGAFEEAFQLFRDMAMEGFLPAKVGVISILSSCVGEKHLAEGKRLHACVGASDLRCDLEVGNTIIHMYSRCRCSSEALEFFYGMPLRNVVSFNTAVASLIRDESYREALDLFPAMNLYAIAPSDVTFIGALSACGLALRLSEVRCIHACVLLSGFAGEVVVGNALLNAYGKCRSSEEAETLFWKMPHREAATWNCMIASYLQQDRHEEALQLFHQMQAMGPSPNNVTFTGVLSVCAGMACLPEGRRLHSRLSSMSPSPSDVVLGTALVNMYGKCGSFEDACIVFGGIPIRDVILWNAMIEIYVRFDRAREAVQAFEEMVASGAVPTKATFVNVLSGLTDLSEAKRMHEIISQRGLETDVIVATSLVNLYSKCGSFDDALAVFDKMAEHDPVSWNAFLAAGSRHGAILRLLSSFQSMLSEGILPDRVSFLTLCDACGTFALLAEGIRIHALVVSCKLDADIQLRGSIVSMYGKCGNAMLSERAFEETVERDEMAWNAVIASHAQAGGRADDALRRFRQMQEEGCLPGRFTHANLLSGFASCEDAMRGERVHAALVRGVLEADAVIVNALIAMYARCEKKTASARMIFDEAPVLDVVTWNAMLASYEDKLEALQLLGRMLLAGVTPDRVTYVSLVSACASQSLAAEGKRMHARIAASKYGGDVNLGNALVSMYARCGCARDASIVFENMRERDVVSWNAIITAYALCGSGYEAIGLYDRMVRFVTPNRVTYLVVLVACSHAGLLEEAFFFFFFCSPIHGLEPAEEHYNCIVELLGRSGLVEESERIVDLSPSLRNSALAWATLLGFCRVHCDEGCGERAASNALHLEPGNSSLYVLLSNIYASSSSSS